MSISYNAKLVCGFPITVEEVKVAKTKYNVDTGDPYTAEELSHEVVLIDGVQIASTEEEEGIFWGPLEGLEFGESGYEQGQKYLGCVMGIVDDGCNFQQIHTNIPPLVAVFAEKYDLKPRWLLALSCG